MPERSPTVNLGTRISAAARACIRLIGWQRKRAALAEPDAIIPVRQEQAARDFVKDRIEWSGGAASIIYKLRNTRFSCCEQESPTTLFHKKVADHAQKTVFGSSPCAGTGAGTAAAASRNL